MIKPMPQAGRADRPRVERRPRQAGGEVSRSYTFDDSHCLMRASLGDKGYLTLALPWGLSTRDLQCVRELIDLTLQGQERTARKKEAEDAEYSSWFPDPTLEYAPRNIAARAQEPKP